MNPAGVQQKTALYLPCSDLNESDLDVFRTDPDFSWPDADLKSLFSETTESPGHVPSETHPLVCFLKLLSEHSLITFSRSVPVFLCVSRESLSVINVPFALQLSDWWDFNVAINRQKTEITSVTVPCDGYPPEIWGIMRGIQLLCGFKREIMMRTWVRSRWVMRIMTALLQLGSGPKQKLWLV